MNIMVVGSGGREHVLAWKIKQSPRVKQVYMYPGNGGTENIAINCPGSVTDFKQLETCINKYNIDMLVVGPEVPLVAGIADYFIPKGIKVFGPQQQAAELEGSKSFSKAFMQRHGIPTAKYEEFTSVDKARAALDRIEFPTVIKADGLAAGKGVVICSTRQEADRALSDMMESRVFGDAGSKIIIEQFLQGEEASILAFVDTQTIVPMVSSQDHKAVYDGDKGPNTGGMGAYSPAPVIDEAMMETVQKQVLKPIINGLQQDGIVYRGVIYAGLMIQDGVPYVLEFNVRFGDPETQAVIPRLETDIVDIMEAVADDRLSEIDIRWSDNAAVCVVMASGGYPGAYEKGKIITGLDKADPDTLVFHAGTARKNGDMVTSGGRVLGITALAPSIQQAIDKVYKSVGKIHFEGNYYRKDIGHKALNR